MWITEQPARLQTSTVELTRQRVQFPHPLLMCCSSPRRLFTRVIFSGIHVIFQHPLK